jgi:hypothetical protein
MCRQAASPQIHKKKCQVIEDISASDIVIKFDRIEKRWMAVDQDNIAQMHVAVTLPNETRLAPFIEVSTEAVECGLGRARNARAAAGVENSRPLVSESSRIAFDYPGHSCPASTIRTQFRSGVKQDDPRCKAAHQLQIQPAISCEPIEQSFLVKTYHLYQPIDREPDTA